jgi:putative chitinase
VSQFAHETDGFRTTTEYASGAAYEGRRDLGNVRPGDGPRFRGHGMIMITGRANHAKASKALGHDFVAHPTHLAEPRWAALASCWWWQNHGCNRLADANDIEALTRRINGGVNGLAERRIYQARARQVADQLVPRRRG